MGNGEFIPDYEYIEWNYNNTIDDKPKGIGLGLTSMILGIVSLIICCFLYLSIALAIVSIVLALIVLIKNKGGKGFAIAGLSTSSVALIFCIMALYGSTLPDEPKATDDQNTNESISSTTQNSNSVSDKEDETTKVTKPSNVFAPGETVTTDKFKIKFISCELYTDYKSYQEPDKGYVYYRFEFEFENISKNDQSVSSWDFECYTDDYSVEDSYVGDDILNASLSAGKKTKGALYYIVPENAKKIELEYEIDYWRDKKIVFISE